jgi:hypothetical protein
MDLAQSLAGKGPLAGQALVEDAAESPDVGTVIDRSPEELLGAHVAWGADDPAAPAGVGRVLRSRFAADRSGQTEIEYLDQPIRGDPDIAGLDVEVNDALLVSGLEGGGDLAADGEGVVQIKRRRPDPVTQILAGYQLQSEETDPARLFERVDGGDIGMVERGQELRLALEPREPLGIAGDGRRENLDRDLSLEPRVLGDIDDSHAAALELARDPVVADPLGKRSAGLTVRSRAPGEDGILSRWRQRDRLVTQGVARFSLPVRTASPVIQAAHSSILRLPIRD